VKKIGSSREAFTSKKKNLFGSDGRTKRYCLQESRCALSDQKLLQVEREKDSLELGSSQGRDDRVMGLKRSKEGGVGGKRSVQTRYLHAGEMGQKAFLQNKCLREETQKKGNSISKGEGSGKKSGVRTGNIKNLRGGQR